MQSISELIRRIETSSLSIWKWLLVFIGIVFIRNLLEGLSNPGLGGGFLDPATFLFHYPLFYAAVTLAVALVVSSLTDRPLLSVLRLAVVGLALLWVAPIVDLLVTSGAGWTTAYIFGGVKAVVVAAISYFGPLLTEGITPGIRFGVAIGLVATFLYARRATGSAGRALLTAIAVYGIIVIFFTAPSIIASLTGSVGWEASPNAVAGFYREMLDGNESLIGRHWLVESVTRREKVFGARFSVMMAQGYFLACVILALIVFRRLAPYKLVAWLKNGRWLRVFNLLALSAIGVSLATFTGHPSSLSLPNVMSFLVLAVSLVAAWFSAVAQNDLADIRLDRVANPGRPLISGSLSSVDLRWISRLCIATALVGAGLLGWLPLFALGAFLVLYALYSCFPIRLKRVFIIGNVLVAFAQFSALFLGFVAVSAATVTTRAVGNIFLLILLMAFFGVWVKDIKDIAGDRHDRIPTLPVRFGERRGALLTAILVVISAILPALLFRMWPFWVASGAGSIIVPWLIFRKPFREALILVAGIAYWFFFIAMLPSVLAR